MTRRRDDVAIVGMACRFPGAADLVAFWENILAGVDATGPVPVDRWDPADYFDPADAPTRRGGYLAGPIPFHPGRHGVMPRAVEGGEPEQFLMLDVARSAWDDAGLPDGPTDGRRAEVVVARGNYFNRGNLTRLSHGRILEQTAAILESLHPGWSAADRRAVRADLRAGLPPFEGATIPGQLTNATAGRVNDRLDLRGASYVVDAASASALVALDLAARSLRTRRADLALVGAVYLEADVDFPLVFDRLGALSKSGRARPFATDADGLLSGEGAGAVVLKRRGDAERDGDRIYAIVRGVGVAADGRGAGLAAPSARGHARAIRRAYRRARADPAEVGLIEGHGLGLPAADRAELEALRATFPPDPRGRRALGAVSSMIGHAMPAAGMAGLIKAALALHHRALPPTLHADRPHPRLLRPDSPARLNARARPWVHGAGGRPRLAGVNAFGFAGINAHAVLAAHPSSDRPDAPGALTTWDAESFLLAGSDRRDLADRAEALADQLADHPDALAKDLAFTLNSAVDPRLPHRLGLVAGSAAELAERLRAVIPRLRDERARSIRDGRGAYFWDRGPTPEAPRVAFLFPGEGSQYPGMLGDLAPHFPEVRTLLDTSDRIAREAAMRGGEPDAPWPSEVLFGPGDVADGLWSAGVAVNVVLSAQWALYQLLRRLAIRPDAILGHSSGEILALAAAGVAEVDRAFEGGLGMLGSLFGRLEGEGDLPTARLVAVAADRGRVEAAIADAGRRGRVEVAMDNCPHQVVVAGGPAAVDAVVDRLRGEGVACEALPFSRAYHTPAFEPAVGPIRDFFGSIRLNAPEVPVYSCATGGRMPDDPAAIGRLAVAQWTRAVAFRPAVEAMHAAGVGVFVDVGARGNLAGFVEDTLRGRPAFAVAANLPRRSGTTQLGHLVASLFAQGVALDTTHLYARRRPVRIDLAAGPARDDGVMELQIGFPAMRLTAGLINRLASRGGPAATNGHLDARDFEGRLAPPPPPGDGRSTADHATRHLEGIEGMPGQTTEPPPPAAEPGEPAEAVLLDFQRTMTDFLATQGAVIGSFLGGRAAAEDPIPGRPDGRDGEPGEIEFVTSDRSTPDGPWAGRLAAFEPGKAAVVHLRLDAAGDPVAEHHTLGGRRISAVHGDWRGLPVLPFSVMAEMLVQCAGRLAPEEWTVVALRDVRAHRWIRYEESGPGLLEIRAAVEEGEGPVAAERVVRVAIHNRGGEATAAERPLEPAVFDGAVVFAPGPLDPPPAPAFALADARPCRFTARSIYAEQWLFHGPALRAVAAIGPIAPGGIEGTLRVLPRGPLLRDPTLAAQLRTDPIALDNFTHLLGGWGLDELADHGDVIFPLRMEELAIYGPQPADGTEVACRIAVEAAERHRVRARTDLVRPDGTTWMSIRGWEDWRFRWPGRYRDGFRQPDRTFLGEPLPLPGLAPEVGAAVWLEPPGDMGRPVWRDVLEHVQLGPDERAALLALPGTDLRRTHRLWGRIAAKEAARRVDAARGLPATYPADLIVVHDALGRPGLADRAEPGRARPHISIAHVAGVAVALAAADDEALAGIDVEEIVDRPPGFADVAFSKLERGLLGGRSDQQEDRAEWSARLWSVKEAAAKATGVGFVAGPQDVEVVTVGPPADDEGRTCLVGFELRGELAAACPALAGRTVAATSARRGDFAWAWTVGKDLSA